MSFHLETDAPDVLEIISGFLKRLISLADKLLERAASRAEKEIAPRVPRRTGSLLRSLGRTVVKRIAIVGLRARHARYLEFGTRPHEIKPRRARALRFSIGGRVFFARRVLHPGIKPRFFLRSAYEALLHHLPTVAEEAWEDVSR